VGLFDKHLEILEDIHKKIPSDVGAAVQLFNSYVARNDFKNMNGLAAKLDKQLG
jgi:hypothetical protein